MKREVAPHNRSMQKKVRSERDEFVDFIEKRKRKGEAPSQRN